MAPAKVKRVVKSYPNNNNNRSFNTRSFNRFADLAQEEDGMATDDEPASVELPVTNQPISKLPPIKVISKPCEVIHDLCSSIGVNDYCVKKISIGVKIFCDSEESHEKVTSALLVNNLEFFTHPKKSDKLFKAVLFGLDGKSADNVKDALDVRGFKCKEIKSVYKERTFGTDTLFIVAFERGSINLQDLKRKIPTLFHTVIRWDHHRKPKDMLVQCRNCQLLGHGERNCHVNTKCARCGKDHKTDCCTVVNNFTCANCGLAHTSFDKQCPQRLLYQEIRNKSRIHSKTVKPIDRAGFSLQNHNFPPVAPGHGIYPNYSTVNTYASVARSGPNLFSEVEISELLLDMLPKLRRCQSKEEQFQTITQLAIKYLYNCN